MYPFLQSFLRTNFYPFINRTNNLPTPGAEAFAFNGFMLPINEWKGPGEVVRQQLFLTSPQVYQTQTPIPTGIAGIQAGQIALAQLMDNGAG